MTRLKRYSLQIRPWYIEHFKRKWFSSSLSYSHVNYKIIRRPSFIIQGTHNILKDNYFQLSRHIHTKSAHSPDLYTWNNHREFWKMSFTHWTAEWGVFLCSSLSSSNIHSTTKSIMESTCTATNVDP